jgi:hypothetical protein
MQLAQSEVDDVLLNFFYDCQKLFIQVLPLNNVNDLLK